MSEVIVITKTSFINVKNYHVIDGFRATETKFTATWNSGGPRIIKHQKSQGQFIVYVLSAKSTILDGYWIHWKIGNILNGPWGDKLVTPFSFYQALVKYWCNQNGYKSAFLISMQNRGTCQVLTKKKRASRPCYFKKHRTSADQAVYRSGLAIRRIYSHCGSTTKL